MIFIFVLYLITTFLLGWTMVKKWFTDLPTLLSIVGAFMLGTGIGVPITYFLAALFSKTSEPMLWGAITTTALAIAVSIKYQARKKHIYKISSSEALVILFSIVFSAWLMTKTFHGNAAGELFVGSNNIFDFGLAIGLVRSMSWGTNIPIQEPFFAGFPLFYHFFFAFWVALWEYFGAPLTWAMNIPSIVSFAAMLMVIYYLPQTIAKQKPIVGWVAVLLTITNSSLTFWQLLIQKGMSFDFIRDVWRLPTYPFAGPFDGSTISIFVTLNSYVNQRHLAFAMALALFLYMNASRSKIFLGFATGMLMLWNTVIYGLTVTLFSFLYVIRKEWKSVAPYLLIAVFVGGLWLLPIAALLPKALLFLRFVTTSGVQPPPTWNIIDYLWQNLGILPFVAWAGFLALPKKLRDVWMPFVVLFALSVILYRGFEQKTYSFFIIGINVLAAVGLSWLWKRGKKIAVLLLAILTISGVVDLTPIKNEFAYPLIGKDSLPLISWIRTSTPKNAVFISYEDMIDPVVLAGRTNYYGFFKNVGQYDRSPDVKRVYAGEVSYAKTIGISYILVPKWQKNDFPYQIRLDKLPVAYEDARFRVFRVE